MYRKSMRSALAEARAYTEANMKRILQALQDKLSKEGGAAGFDDLRKTAKSMGLNLTPQMLKNMPGIKQHRDGDYILEGTIDESLDVRYDTKKQGWFDRQGRRRYLGKMATNALMKKALDKAIRTGDFINPYKLKHGQKPEETELEEVTAVYTDKKTRQVKSKKFKDKQTANDYFRRTGEASGQITYKEETELEETITEFKKMVVTIADPMKRAKAMDDIKRFGKNTGFRIDKMSDGKSFRIDGKGADLNKFAIDMKNYYGAEIKAESIEEAFTKKDFQKLETTNDHTEAAKKLINMFGTNQEKKTMADIERRHEKTGYISGTDYKMRQIMVNKYYSRLK